MNAQFWHEAMMLEYPGDSIIFHNSNSGFLCKINNEVTDLSEDDVNNIYLKYKDIVDAKFDTINKIYELEDFLRSTDHKILPDYEPLPNEDIDAIILRRKEARAYIRENTKE